MHRKSITQFYEGFRWLLEIGMFIALGLLANLKILLEVAPLGLGLSFVLMLIARPISVFVSLFISGFTAKQKAFISWVGLRGAVPVVFATYLYGERGLDNNGLAAYLFHLIFFIVLTSVMVQGSTLHGVAKRLGLLDKKKVPKSRRHVLEIDEDVKRILIQLEIPEDSPAHEEAVVNLGLPKTTLIVLVWRDHNYFQPRGSTILKKYDKLFVVVDNKKRNKRSKNVSWTLNSHALTMDKNRCFSSALNSLPKKRGGCDEAGRGCLAGPVVAGVVVLPQHYMLPSLKDSKQLTAKQREGLAIMIKKQGCGVGYRQCFSTRDRSL